MHVVNTGHWKGNGVSNMYILGLGRDRRESGPWGISRLIP